MDHVHADLLRGEFDEGIGEGFDGTVHVGLDNDVELLEVAQRNAAADLLQGDVRLRLDALDAEQLLALGGDVARLFFIFQDVQVVTGGRCTVQAEDGNRSGRTGLLDLLAALVEHGLDAAGVAAGQHHVADMDGSALD